MSNFPLPRTAGRAGLAVSAAALLAFGLAAPAAADPVETSDGSVRAKYDENLNEEGKEVTMDTAPDGINTNLFTLKLEDDSELTAYCIDIETGIRDGYWYNEDDWNEYGGEGTFAEPGKVHWILQEGYPSVSHTDLADRAGSGVSSARVTEKEALAATQAAIWHFSNGANLDTTRPDPHVKGIYDYLVEDAEELPQEEPTLEVTPDSASGQAGGTVGEFEVSTNADEVPVELGDGNPDGVELVDVETGEAVEHVSDGDKVGFAVPEDADPGEASFSLETTATVKQGRLFKGDEDKNKKDTQTLITAEDSEGPADASASAEWAKAHEPDPSPSPSPRPSPDPTPSGEPSEPSGKPSDPGKPGDDKPAPPKDDEPTLPVTGGALAGLVAAGVAALGAGGGALYLSRKRKSGIGLDQDV